VLVGCAGGSKSASPSTETITIAAQQHPAVDALQQLLPTFEKETGIKVNLDILPQEQLNTKVQMAMASNSSDYDVIMIDDMTTGQYAKANWIVPLNKFMNDPKLTDANQFKYNDFLKGFVNALSINNQQYGLPFYGESMVLMYNKDMFAKAHIANPPSTMDELVADAQKLTGNGQYGIALRGARSINWYPWAGFLMAYGGHWLVDNKPTINTPEAIQATQVYANLINKYGPPGGANFDWNQVQLSMQQGQVAMIIDASNFGPRLEDPTQSKVVGKVGYAMVPSGPAGRFPSVYTTGLCIPAGSKHQDAAWKFINWATSQDFQLQSAMIEGRLDVTRQSVWQDPKFQAKYNNQEMVQSSIQSMNEANPDYLPRIPQFSQLSSIVGIAINKVITGTDAKTALDEAQKELEPLFNNQ
jgi:ABC-type glycerol-3-phosphate transport system substrate-binding protein